MNPPVILFILVIIAVLLIIWWWNRRNDDRPAEETYHANPFTGTAASQAAHTPAVDAHAGGGHDAAMAEPLAVSEPLTEAMVAEHATPEAAELPAAADPMVIAPDLVLGDESRLTAMAVEPEYVEPVVAEVLSAPPPVIEPAPEPAPAAADVVAPKADIRLGDEAPLAAVPDEPAIPAASVAEPVLVVLPVDTITPVAPRPIDPPTPIEPVAVTPVVETLAPVEPATPVVTAKAAAPAEPAVAAAPSEPTAPAAPADVKVDDLVIIEGIGPKINSVLQDAGIRSFADLAAAKPAALREILTAAKLYTADPTTWPQQAKLAAAGKWTQLKTLQEKLDGGRKA